MKIVYIDASNLKNWVKDSDWELDYKSFYFWLKDKFQATKVVLFMWMVPKYTDLYNYLQSIWYDIVFKPTSVIKNKKIKWNVDWELILEAMKDFYEKKLENFILVSGDWDYHCLVEFFKQKNLKINIIAPNKTYLSYLLNKLNVPIVFLDDFKQKLNKK